MGASSAIAVVSCVYSCPIFSDDEQGSPGASLQAFLSESQLVAAS